jgi:Holliday junction resolvase RusA-like endonuclease
VKLVITGSPRTAKNSQRIFTNKRTGKPFITSGKSAADWGPDAVRQLVEQRCAQGPVGMRCLGPHVDFPLRNDVHVKALIYRDRRSGDLDNFEHAIGDALQKAGVIKNDNQIESWDGSRKLIDRINPRVEIEITPMETPCPT